MARKSPISRSGRFSKSVNAEVQDYSESVSFDWRLYRQDIAGSIAHATMLCKKGILSGAEKSKIVAGLKRIEKEIVSGKMNWKQELEDLHMNIEALLSSRVPAAAKLHTARSRNDQVATDLRLWVRGQIVGLKSSIQDLQLSLIGLAEKSRLKGKNVGFEFLPIPGYTHLQRAQPVLFAHHLLAYVEMLQRDFDRFSDCSYRLNVCPLGSGAIAGTSLSLDRKMTARLLGFREPSANSMDAVSDRDFVAEFLFAAALTGIHLSRLAEDLILWSTVEFGYITIGDSYTTGSSLMPQKKNPDAAELARGKSGRLVGNLVSLLTILKGLPMTYNRDLQEDKEPLFDSADTLSASLSVFTGMMKSISFNVRTCLKAVADPSLLATELADYLVKKGVPFRKAHHVVGSAVHLAEKSGRTLGQLTFSEWQKIHPAFKRDVKKALDPKEFFKSRNSLAGAPGVKQVEEQLRMWKKRIG